jgi:hypothetical protein
VNKYTLISKKFITAKFDVSSRDRNNILMNNSVQDIINEIVEFITNSSSNPSSVNWKEWYIGLTVYPNQEKRELKNINKWKAWKALSSNDANQIQNYFIENYSVKQSRNSEQYDYFVYVYSLNR